MFISIKYPAYFLTDRIYVITIYFAKDCGLSKDAVRSSGRLDTKPRWYRT